MLARLMILLIRVYQLVLSPVMGNQCRFHPTCSAYSREAFEKHGFIKGLWLMTARICRCHPWYRGTWVDPVPDQLNLPMIKGLAGFASAGVFRYKRRQTTEQTQCCHGQHKHELSNPK